MTYGHLSGVQIPGGPFYLIDRAKFPGSVFFVNSATGSNAAGYGSSPSAPVASIDYAIGLCTAHAGDVVVVQPGHAETVSGAAGINIDVAGIAIIGQGNGTKRPTITLSAVGSTVAFGAANCRIENLLFVTTAASTIVLDVNKTDCEIVNCEIRSGAGIFVTAIDINGGSANACDRVSVERCVINAGSSAGANQGIEIGEVADRVSVKGCLILGDYANAAIHNPTGKVATNLLITDNALENLQTGDHSLELVSACTGILARNLYKNDMTQATGCDPGSCFSFECYHCDVIDASAILCPAAT